MSQEDPDPPSITSFPPPSIDVLINGVRAGVNTWRKKEVPLSPYDASELSEIPLNDVRNAFACGNPQTKPYKLKNKAGKSHSVQAEEKSSKLSGYANGASPYMTIHNAGLKLSSYSSESKQDNAHCRRGSNASSAVKVRKDSYSVNQGRHITSSLPQFHQSKTAARSAQPRNRVDSFAT